MKHQIDGNRDIIVCLHQIYNKGQRETWMGDGMRQEEKIQNCIGKILLMLKSSNSYFDSMDCIPGFYLTLTYLYYLFRET